MDYPKIKNKTTAIELVNKFGLVRPFAKAYDRYFNIDKLPIVDDAITDFSPDSYHGKVLIPMVMGRHSEFGSYLDAVLGHALKIRGYEPVMLLCDGDLDMCLSKQWQRSESAACEICNFVGTEFLQRFGLDYKKLDDFGLSHRDYDSDGDIYRGINVGHIALSSTRAYYKIYHLDNHPDGNDTYLRFKKSAKLLVDIAYELFEDNSFEAIVSNDSVYLIGGVFSNVGRQFDTPGWDIDVGFWDQSLLCGNSSNRSSLPTFPNRKSALSRVDTPLSNDESEEIEDLMRKRMTGTDVRFDHSQLASQSFHSSDSGDIYGAFTNLPWDGSLTANGEMAFDDVFSWIETTIEFFRDHPDKQLYIKTHPAETLRTTNESFYDWILSEFELGENIGILPPDTNVNPYEFMESIDRGVVWNSTSGLEMAYLGIPVVVAGDTHYRGFGFTNDANNEQDYLQLLTADLSMDSEEILKAKRYSHYLFIERHVDFPFYEMVNDDFRPISPSHDDLKHGNENIDILIEAIVNNRPIPEIKKDLSK